jgi:hypothetical protein
LPTLVKDLTNEGKSRLFIRSLLARKFPALASINHGRNDIVLGLQLRISL